ncbi:MAG: hypothetical protein ABL878_16915, partial [Burkholderiales bacterium]
QFSPSFNCFLLFLCVFAPLHQCFCFLIQNPNTKNLTAEPAPGSERGTQRTQRYAKKNRSKLTTKEFR